MCDNPIISLYLSGISSFSLPLRSGVWYSDTDAISVKSLSSGRSMVRELCLPREPRVQSSRKWTSIGGLSGDDSLHVWYTVSTFVEWDEKSQNTVEKIIPQWSVLYMQAARWPTVIHTMHSKLVLCDYSLLMNAYRKKVYYAMFVSRYRSPHNLQTQSRSSRY